MYPPMMYPQQGYMPMPMGYQPMPVQQYAPVYQPQMPAYGTPYYPDAYQIQAPAFSPNPSPYSPFNRQPMMPGRPGMAQVPYDQVNLGMNNQQAYMNQGQMMQPQQMMTMNGNPNYQIPNPNQQQMMVDPNQQQMMTMNGNPNYQMPNPNQQQMMVDPNQQQMVQNPQMVQQPVVQQQPAQTVDPNAALAIPPQNQPVQPTPTGFVPTVRSLIDGPLAEATDAEVTEEIKQAAKDPQVAFQLITKHGNTAIEAREEANHRAWGAKYYGEMALKLAQELATNKSRLSPQMKQATLAKIQRYQELSAERLNECKMLAIQAYNSCVKATLAYNRLFTGTGPFINFQTDADKRQQFYQVLNQALDDMWNRWEKGFMKEWQGRQVLATPARVMVELAEVKVKADQEATVQILNSL